jgi:hypothetical protein
MSCECLVAASGLPRKLGVAGEEPRNVFTLCGLGDFGRIRHAAAGASKAVVVGGRASLGWRSPHGRLSGGVRDGGLARAGALRGRPFFWTGRHKAIAHHVGCARTWEEVEFDGNPARRQFLACYIAGGHVVAAAGRERSFEMAAIAETIRQPDCPTVDEVWNELRQIGLLQTARPAPSTGPAKSSPTCRAHRTEYLRRAYHY